MHRIYQRLLMQHIEYQSLIKASDGRHRGYRIAALGHVVKIARRYPIVLYPLVSHLLHRQAMIDIGVLQLIVEPPRPEAIDDDMPVVLRLATDILNHRADEEQIILFLLSQRAHPLQTSGKAVPAQCEN